MNELEQLKAKYQELGAVNERMEKGEAEFKPLEKGYYAYPTSGSCKDYLNPGNYWNVMPTEAEAERLGKIFQAVAEQEHLVKFVNGDWEWNRMNSIVTLRLSPNIEIIASRSPSLTAPIFKDVPEAERALKLASPNLLAYWKREL